MRDRRRILATVAAVALVGLSCAQPEKKPEAPAIDPVAVKAEIEAANARMIDAMKKGDKPGMLANYASDAVVMLPGMPAAQGSAAIDKAATDFLGQLTLTDGSATTTDVMIAGDLAIETGAYSQTFKPKKGAEFTDKGKYLTVWKKQADGSWKVAADLGNSAPLSKP